MLTLTNRIDMRPGAVPLVIHLGQYDSDFSLVFELYSSAGNFTVESGTTAMIRGTKTDGNAYDADATIDVSAKTVTVAGSEQMTAAKGRNVYELVLTKSGKVLSTANFILDVERAAMDADTIASESVLKELNAIIAGAETATEAAQTATAAAESVSGSAAQIATNTADISDLKADYDALYEASNLKAEPLNNEVFEIGSEINRASNTGNYYMDASGTNIYDTNFVTDKYIVFAGSLLHLNIAKDSAYVWAFRDGAGFVSNVIGVVNSVGGSLFVTVPDGATYLFISRFKTTTNHVYNAKSIVAEHSTAIAKNSGSIDTIMQATNAHYQHLDATKWTAKKYYGDVNTVRNTDDSGYAIYPELTVPAGTYHYSGINTNFSYGSNATQASFKPFTTIDGTVTFSEETKLYITFRYPATDFTKCMLADGILPVSYVYGVYFQKSIKIVDANGNGDFTNIQDAINACNDLDRYNVQTGIHETIVVYPGVYSRFSMGAGGNVPIPRRNISIIGIDRQKCIVRDDDGLYKYPPAEIRTDGTIANLTFIATHDNGDASTTESKDQYAVHLDYGYCVETFENCTFISYCNAAVGIGLYANEELTFRNCKFISYADSSVWGGTAPNGIYCHTNTTDGTFNQNLTLIDCECVAEHSPYGGSFQIIQNTGESTQFLKLIRNLFYGNNGFGVSIQNGWDTSMSYGNSIDVT